jgi:hypothetical protein
MLQHVYRQKHQPWSAESERDYQQLHAIAPIMLQMAGDPELHPDLLGNATAEEWRHTWEVYEELRFARLCTYLQTRPPDAMIGYSILIFELDETELTHALDEDLNALVSLVENAATRPFAPTIY